MVLVRLCRPPKVLAVCGLADDAARAAAYCGAKPNGSFGSIGVDIVCSLLIGVSTRVAIREPGVRAIVHLIPSIGAVSLGSPEPRHWVCFHLRSCKNENPPHMLWTYALKGQEDYYNGGFISMSMKRRYCPVMPEHPTLRRRIAANPRKLMRSTNSPSRFRSTLRRQGGPIRRLVVGRDVFASYHAPKEQTCHYPG